MLKTHPLVLGEIERIESHISEGKARSLSFGQEGRQYVCDEHNTPDIVGAYL